MLLLVSLCWHSSEKNCLQLLDVARFCFIVKLVRLLGGASSKLWVEEKHSYPYYWPSICKEESSGQKLHDGIESHNRPNSSLRRKSFQTHEKVGGQEVLYPRVSSRRLSPHQTEDRANLMSQPKWPKIG